MWCVQLHRHGFQGAVAEDSHSCICDPNTAIVLGKSPWCKTCGLTEASIMKSVNMHCSRIKVSIHLWHNAGSST